MAGVSEFARLIGISRTTVVARCASGRYVAVRSLTKRKCCSEWVWRIDIRRTLSRLTPEDLADITAVAVRRRLARAAYREDARGRPTKRAERIAQGDALKAHALLASAAERPVSFGVPGEIVHVEDTRGVTGNPRKYWGSK